MVTTIIMAAMIAASTSNASGSPLVATGADCLVSDHLGMLKDKRVGLVINHTSRLSSGAFLVDTLQKAGITITALFGPEHGVRGSAGAGEKVADGVDAQSGITAYSLYGERNKPTPEMLRNVDLLIYDIQDVGARFYTYISTLKLCMEAAAEQNIPFMVLDRPDPLGALVDGPLMEDSLRSFVGVGPVPVVYGMTCGELANFMNATGWMAGGKKADLTVIRMKGWSRGMTWGETGLPWTAPSPNIPTPETAIVYPATCFMEATQVSEGRGTASPFFQIGAPFLKSDALAAAFNARHLPGVRAYPAHFTPTSSKHAGELCHGIRLEVTDRVAFKPVCTGLVLISELLQQAPDSVKLNHRWLGKLLGKGSVAHFLEKGGNPVSLLDQWESEISCFKEKSSNLWLYPAK
jgi:uncharacterized protein YbbC (DUF1343 family)